jgi:hypothetical protein
VAKSYRKITLQSGAVRYYRADIYEEGGPHGGAKLYESIPDGEILLESAVDFDDVLGIDNKPVTRNESRRNNGSNRSAMVAETDKNLAQQVEQFGRSYGWSRAEAILFLHEPPKMHGAYQGISESEIRSGWDRFDDILTKAEIDTLVKGRVVAPERKK